MPVSGTGRPRVDDELILRAILYRLRQGCTWRALSIFAPYSTIYGRWKQWCDSGLWDKLLEQLTQGAKGKLWAIDSTCVKVHKHGMGGRQYIDNQCIGKTKGGQNTKIHALVDGKGRPLRLILSPGNRNDIIYAPKLVEGQTDRHILADKAYDCDEFRDLLKQLGLTACIPPRENRKNPATFHKGHYKRRHKVENAFQRLKELRAIATRYEKKAARFIALTTLATITIWIKADF